MKNKNGKIRTLIFLMIFMVMSTATIYGNDMDSAKTTTVAKQDQRLSLFQMNMAKKAPQKDLTLTINSHFAPGEAHQEEDRLPATRIIVGFFEGAKFAVKSETVRGFVASPFIVSGTFEREHIVRDVFYYVDKNENGIPDKDENKYRLDVSFEYATGEEGSATLPQRYVEEGLSRDDSYQVDVPQVDGYVSSVREIQGVIIDHDIVLTVVYAKDENGNAIPDREEALFTVVFQDYNQLTIMETTVLSGMDAKIPDSPQRAGYTFTGWSGNYQKVMQDEIVIATYSQNPIIPVLPTLPNPPVNPIPPLTPLAIVTPALQLATLPTSPNVSPNEPIETVKQETTPKAKGPETVTELETPLAKGVAGGNDWAVLNLVMMIMSVWLGIATVFIKKLAANEHVSMVGKCISSILMTGSIALFLFTQDVSLTMAWVDQWSFVMIAITAIQLATLVTINKGEFISEKQAQENK